MDTILDEAPQREDGTIDLTELARLLLERTVNDIMDAQADELVGEGNRRNGYRERGLLTAVGEITLRIPKLREGTYFPDELIRPYSRVDRAVVGAVREVYVRGLSTRKIDKAAAELEFGSLSPSRVSRMVADLDEEVAALRAERFAGMAFPYLWLDATYMKCRDGGHVSSTALVTAIACGDDGYRRLVGLDAVDTESYLGWRGFLQSLRERGVEGVACVTSDAHEGLRRAIVEVFPGAAWQRCIVHLERNAMSLARNRRQRAAVGTILHAVFAERDPALVRELYHLAVDEIGGFCPKAAELLEEAEPDALAYLDFPYDHHRRLRTNNVQERANREIKRRSRVVQVFPSRRSLIRMVGAVLSEMDESWSARRWFDGESVAGAYEAQERRKPAPEPAYEGTAAEHAARIMAVILSSGVDPAGKAA
jgi:putative transposase